MIQVQNLCKEFDGFHALNGATLHVEKGCVYGLVGPNGSGKTTLLQHLAGVYRQDAGSILIDGKEVYENPDIKARIAYIPDDIYYFPQANLNEMMKYYRGCYPGFSKERFERLSEAFPEIDLKRPLRKLSKGMLKQVGFWLALSCCPDVILLDEPVDGLDPLMRHQIWSLLLSDVASRNVTVLVSSHNLRELEDVCSHIGIMKHGKVLVEQSFEELDRAREDLSLEEYFIKVIGGGEYEVKDILIS
ncbi:MAG: ABC transporter ATP-binding protein [Lachnospiraceae bacterium]